MDIAGKAILVTGGSKGIGKEIVKKLHAQKATVIACGRETESLDQLAAEVPGVHVAVCDVTRLEQVKALKEFCRHVVGRIDILINNAAIFRRFDILDEAYGLDAQVQEIDINLVGPIMLTHVFLPDLVQQKESVIVNLTSPSAFLPLVKAPIYSATKAAIQSWTLSLREQLKDTGVRVIDLNPPAVDTQMNKNNPGVEGMTLMSPEKFADIFVKGLQNGQDEIMPSHAGFLRVMRRVAPGLAFRVMNKNG